MLIAASPTMLLQMQKKQQCHVVLSPVRWFSEE